MIHDYNTTILLTYSWMVAGFTLMVLDLKFTQSIFLLFAGLGAIATSVALAIHPELSWPHQALIFIATTLLFTILMFNPLRFLLHRKKSYKNIEGQKAIIIDPPQPWRTYGTARWSGTVIRIKLDDPKLSHDLRSGDSVEIVTVDGNVFTVLPLIQEDQARTNKHISH